jgi:single-stranded-DNA-specific exonuclease
MSARLGDLAAEGPGLALADWGAVALDPGLAARFEHVVMVDPPPFPHLEARARRGEGYLHLAWGDAEVELALRVHDAEWPLRQGLAASFRALREASAAGGGAAGGEALIRALAGDGRHPRTPEQAARRARVLDELGLLDWQGMGTSRTAGVVSSEGRDLERSGAFRAYRARHEEGKRFLNSKRQTQR